MHSVLATVSGGLMNVVTKSASHKAEAKVSLFVVGSEPERTSLPAAGGEAAA